MKIICCRKRIIPSFFRRTVLLLWGLSLSALSPVAHAEGDESGLKHEFWLYYLSVQHSLKGNVGELRSAAALDRVNPKATRFLAKFWWKKVQRDCVETRPKSTVLIANTRDDVDIMQNVDEDIKYCAYDVLYDNWDDINASILNRLRTEQQDTRRAILTSLAEVGLTGRIH